MNFGVGCWRERVDYAISNLRPIHVTLLSYARAREDQAQTLFFLYGLSLTMHMHRL